MSYFGIRIKSLDRNLDGHRATVVSWQDAAAVYINIPVYNSLEATDNTHGV